MIFVISILYITSIFVLFVFILIDLQLLHANYVFLYEFYVINDQINIKLFETICVCIQSVQSSGNSGFFIN